MSRFSEGDGWDDEADQREFEKELRAAYKAAKPDLRGFLQYLDAMPRKRIIAAAFVDRASGETCAVATFCAYKGVPKRTLYKIERDSSAQRRMNDGPEDGDGWHGPTVNAGQEAGLPEYVAHDLAWRNDMAWDRVQTGVIEHPGKKGRTQPGDPMAKRPLIPDDENGTHWIERPWTERVYGEMTPEERWLRLRNYVAKKVGSPPIPPPIEWPAFLRERSAQ